MQLFNILTIVLLYREYNVDVFKGRAVTYTQHQCLWTISPDYTIRTRPLFTVCRPNLSDYKIEIYIKSIVYSRKIYTRTKRKYSLMFHYVF